MAALCTPVGVAEPHFYCDLLECSSPPLLWLSRRLLIFSILASNIRFLGLLEDVHGSSCQMNTDPESFGNSLPFDSFSELRGALCFFFSEFFLHLANLNVVVGHISFLKVASGS